MMSQPYLQIQLTAPPLDHARYFFRLSNWWSRIQNTGLPLFWILSLSNCLVGKLIILITVHCNCFLNPNPFFSKTALNRCLCQNLFKILYLKCFVSLCQTYSVFWHRVTLVSFFSFFSNFNTAADNQLQWCWSPMTMTILLLSFVSYLLEFLC